MRYKILVLLFLTLGFTACQNSGNQGDSPSNSDSAASHPARTGDGDGSLKATINATPGQRAEQSIQAVGEETAAKSDAHLNTGGLEWTTFERIAANAPKDTRKKYLVDVYTDWCGWCKVMDKKTFTDPGVQKYLRDNFHVVKFDAEQKSNVPFKGRDYQWMPNGRKGINQLAIELLGNRLSYPTLVYLDENMNKITASPGYKTPEQLMAELKAIADMKS